MKRGTITGIFTTFILLFETSAMTRSGESHFLMDTIKQTEEKIAGELSEGSRMAIVAFDSAHDNLSDYIMEEQTSRYGDTGAYTINQGVLL